MKNIAGFYCKQPSLPLNTGRKGYRISHRLSPHPGSPTSLPKPSTAKSAPGLGLEGGKGGKSGLQSCVGPLLWVRGVCSLRGSLELPSAGYQLSNTSLDECPGFVFCLLPTSLVLISFPFFFFLLSLLFFYLFFFYFFLHLGKPIFCNDRSRARDLCQRAEKAQQGLA